MKMKWIHSKGTKKNRTWLEDMIDVKAVQWHQLEKNDLVFIAGNLVDGFPTAIYGRHIVIDPEKQILMGRNNEKFFERWPFVYKEIN